MNYYSFYSSAMTVLLLAVFLGIVAWAWSGKRKAAFDEAARLPLEDDDTRATAAQPPRPFEEPRP